MIEILTYCCFWPLCGLLAFLIILCDGTLRTVYNEIQDHLSYRRGFGQYVASSFVWAVCIGPLALAMLVLGRLDKEEN